MPDKIIRVLIVDDSSLMREALRSVISADQELEVVGLAANGKEGVEKALVLKPDVITMDLKMPVMTGLEAIEKIMEEQPVPIIVVSSLDVSVIVKALSMGAMDFVSVAQDIDDIAKDLITKIKIASRVKAVRRLKPKSFQPVQNAVKKTSQKAVAIGVSTGGPQALLAVLSKLPKDFPAPVLIVQHMSKGFIGGLAEWLQSNCSIAVRVAGSQEEVKPGTAYLAPDEYNMTIDSMCRTVLSEESSKLMPHIPSIDVLMMSVAKACGPNSIGLIMTGMGSDGVEGIKAVKAAGGTTIAQDEKTSAVFGMNKAAIATGCVDRVVPLDGIAEELIRTL